MSGKGEVRDAVPDDPQQAFDAVVKAYGVKDMASKLLMKTGTLYNKCDADDGSHNQPTLRDVVRVTAESGNLLILDSLERRFGRVAIDVTPGLDVSDTALLELLCKVSGEHGAMHQALARALSDGKFTRKDLMDVRAEAFDLVQAVMNFVQRMEGMVDD